jgi:gas vesicle protein
MKKLFAVLAVASVMVACNDSATTDAKPTGADTSAAKKDTSIAGAAQQTADTAKKMMDNVADTSKGLMNKVVDGVKDAGTKAVEGVKDAAKDAGTKAVEGVKDAAKDAMKKN